MSTNPITAAISDYRAQEIAAKAAGNTTLAFELGNMIVGLESLLGAHEERVAPLQAKSYFVQREDAKGTRRVGKAYATKAEAEEGASALWEKAGSGFFSLPCFRVERNDGVVVSDPIDCYPYEV